MSPLSRLFRSVAGSAPYAPVAQADPAEFPNSTQSKSNSFKRPIPFYYHFLPVSVSLFLSRSRIPRLLLIALVFCFVYLFVTRLVLYYQTGSFFYQPYSWYDWRTTARRQFPSAQPVNYSSLCQSHSRRPFPDGQTVQQNIQQLIATARDKSKSTSAAPLLTVAVFVDESYPDAFPWFWDFLFYSNSVGPDGCSLFNPDKLSKPIKKTHPMSKANAWANSIEYMYDPETSFEDSDNVWSGRSIRCKVFPELGIRLERLSFPFKPSELARYPDQQNIFFIGDVTSPLFREFSESLESPSNSAFVRPDYRLGFLTWGVDTCQSGLQSLKTIHPHAEFGFITYGECHLVDNDRVFLYPLGPGILHGFPSLIDTARNPPVFERHYTMNLMATYNPDKPSRMQAYLVAERECHARGLSCQLSHSNFLKQIVKVVKSKVKNALIQWNIVKSEDKDNIEVNGDYIEMLRDSDFTLCPVGKNPESYRVWEALLTGSIPIVEEFPYDPATDIHPAYGNHFACGKADILGAYKQMQAPFVWISDWDKDLPGILDLYKENPAFFLKKQHELREWILLVRGRWKDLMALKMLQHFTWNTKENESAKAKGKNKE